MYIEELFTEKIYPNEILPVEITDFESITPTRYFFDWQLESNYEIYKLVLKGKEDILGLISIERIPTEWRIHIRLLTVSIENKGKNKKFDKIIGNLIAYVSKIAIVSFGEIACVSLQPKSLIAEHYITKYKMKITGLTLSLEVPELIHLINEYENEK
jgi:hypothetical protein